MTAGSFGGQRVSNSLVRILSCAQRRNCDVAIAGATDTGLGPIHFSASERDLHDAARKLDDYLAAQNGTNSGQIAQERSKQEIAKSAAIN